MAALVTTTRPLATPDTAMPFPRIDPADSAAPGRMLDAIYVPTMHTRPAPATDANRLLAHASNVVYLFTERPAAWAIESTSDRILSWTELPPVFDRSAYLRRPANNTRSGALMPGYDIPLKRTAALVHAQQEGYTSIGLLDDDIYLSEENLLTARAALNHNVDMASFHILEYPDVSTVEHIERIVLHEPSKISIGGNCLFLSVDAVDTYFPRLYNDDWFFLFAHAKTARIASLGEARQRPYQAWKQPGRARFEQFGDLIIEGLRSRLIDGLPLDDGTDREWEEHLNAALARIAALLPVTEDRQMVDALEEARDELSSIAIREVRSFVANYLTDTLQGDSL